MYRVEIDVVDIDGFEGVFVHLPRAEHVDGVGVFEWYKAFAEAVAEEFVADGDDWEVILNGRKFSEKES